MRINTVPLGAQTYELLLSEILVGKRLAGQKISEESISAEFGISRTPAREALMHLAADGLVERTARKGCRVNHIDHEQQRDLFQCRAMLEAMALKLGFEQIPVERLRDVMTALQQAQRKGDAKASLHADGMMHELILASCPNRSLVEIVHRLLKQCKAFRALRAISTDVASITNERLAIVQAIMDGDKKTAGRLLSAHILQGVPE